MCLTLLGYNTSEGTYTGTKSVVVESPLNGYTVYNGGNTNCWLNGSLIVPGASKSIGGNVGEIFTGNIDLMFSVPAGLTDPPVNSATVTQKWYTNIPTEIYAEFKRNLK
jgi:hypothetical protein